MYAAVLADLMFAGKLYGDVKFVSCDRSIEMCHCRGRFSVIEAPVYRCGVETVYTLY